MAYKKKLEFNLSAVIYTVLATDELYEIFSKEFKSGRENLEMMAESPQLMGGKAAAKMRRILRDHIEKKVATRNFYIDKKEELKRRDNPATDKERQQTEFSLIIKGSGTKAQVAHELHMLADKIEATLLEELRNGIELEESTVVLTTDVPEAYEGEL